MKTVKLLKPMLYLFVLASFLTACKGDDPVAPTISIEGIWTGLTGVANATPSEYLKFDIKTNSNIDFYTTEGSSTPNGSGTWTLTGSDFEAQLTFTGEPNYIYVYVAKFNEKTGELTAGTWGLDANSGGGTWHMKKQ